MIDHTHTDYGVDIECAECGKTGAAPVVVESEHRRHKFTQLPAGWLADIGLADTGQMVCSEKCAQVYARGL